MYSHPGVSYARRFFNSQNAGSYDRIVMLTTLGQDLIWKRKMLKYIQPESVVLELANGTGILSSMLLKNKNLIYGIDLTFDYLKLHVKNKQDGNMSVNGTAELLPFKSNSFDNIISSYLVKYVNLTKLIDECYRVLKNKGIVIFHDFAYPQKNIYRLFWKNYFRILRQLGKVDKNWAIVYDELEGLIIKNKWFNELPSILKNRGFINISVQFQTLETSAIICAEKN